MMSQALAKTEHELLERADSGYGTDYSVLDTILNAVGLSWSEIEKEIPSDFWDLGRLIDKFRDSINA